MILIGLFLGEKWWVLFSRLVMIWCILFFLLSMIGGVCIGMFGILLKLMVGGCFGCCGCCWSCDSVVCDRLCGGGGCCGCVCGFLCSGIGVMVLMV